MGLDIVYDMLLAPRFPASIAAIAFFIASGGALAQEGSADVSKNGTTAPSDTAPTADSAPDIVRLKNGGMTRGTIAEMTPNDSVVIVTITGEKRKFDMKEVAYAGPRREAPSDKALGKGRRSKARAKSSATPSSEDDAVSVSFRAEGEAKTLALHMRVATSDATISRLQYRWQVSSETYEPLCTAPCVTKLAPGNYMFAISADDDRPRAMAESIEIEGKSTLVGNYVSHQNRRRVGWLTFIGSIAAGATIAAVPNMNRSSGSLSTPAIGVGAAVAVVGGLIGLGLGLSGDDYSLTQVE